MTTQKLELKKNPLQWFQKKQDKTSPTRPGMATHVAIRDYTIMTGRIPTSCDFISPAPKIKPQEEKLRTSFFK